MSLTKGTESQVQLTSFLLGAQRQTQVTDEPDLVLRVGLQSGKCCLGSSPPQVEDGLVAPFGVFGPDVQHVRIVTTH